MTTLALDTCFDGCSAAAMSGEPHGIFAACESFRLLGQGHAEQLMTMIAEAMAGADAPFGTLRRIGVTIGPGTFTGTRIGIAAARALSLATGAPLVPVSSLIAVAWRALQDGVGHADGAPVVVCMDARRNQVYCQLVDRSGIAAGDPTLLDVTDAARQFAHLSVGLAGTGAPAVAHVRVTLGAAPHSVIEDLSLANLAGSMLPRLADLPSADGPVRPLYLRAPDAKPQASALARAQS